MKVKILLLNNVHNLHKGELIGSWANTTLEVPLSARESLRLATFQVIVDGNNGKTIITNLKISTSNGLEFQTAHNFSSQGCFF